MIKAPSSHCELFWRYGYGVKKSNIGTIALLGETVRDTEKLTVYKGTSLQQSHRNVAQLDVFLRVHDSSMEIARKIESIIGPEDTAAFIRIVDKMSASGYHL